MFAFTPEIAPVPFLVWAVVMTGLYLSQRNQDRDAYQERAEAAEAEAKGYRKALETISDCKRCAKALASTGGSDG